SVIWPIDWILTMLRCDSETGALPCSRNPALARSMKCGTSVAPAMVQPAWIKSRRENFIYPPMMRPETGDTVAVAGTPFHQNCEVFGLPQLEQDHSEILTHPPALDV